MNTQDPLTRVENIERGLTKPQADKAEAVRQNFKLALATEYGKRLSGMMVEKLTREVVLRPEVLAHLENVSVSELPEDSDGWGVWARDAASNCEFSQRSLASSDNDLRERLTKEVLDSIPRAKKMTMARDQGTLDAYVETEVDRLFEREMAQGYHA